MNDIYEFGDFRMDPAEQLLLRRGVPVALTPRAFEALLILVRSEGRLIEKADFIKQLWPEVFVEEIALAQNISQIRKALGDGRDGVRLVQTVHKRGYRFLPPVSRLACPAAMGVPAVTRPLPGPIPPESDLRPAMDLPTAHLVDRLADGTAPDQSSVPAYQAQPERRLVPWRRLRVPGLLFLVVALVIGVVLTAVRGKAPAVAFQSSTQLRSIPVLSLAGRISDPALSPNAEEIAFVWDGENAVRGDLYVYPLGGERPLRLTHTESGFTCCASWSPDGRRVAFGRCNDDGGAVLIVGALGGPERKVTSVACVYGNAGWPVWTADGKSLVIAAQCSPEGAVGVVVFSLDTGDRRCLSQPNRGDRGDRSPVLSPDGRTVAFIRMHSRTANEIRTVPVEGGPVHVITADGGSFWGLMWSADGKRLIFRSPRRGLSRLWAVSRDGGKVIPENTYPEVGSQSPDGRRLAYVPNAGSLPTEAIRVDLREAGGTIRATETLFADGTTSSGLQPTTDDQNLVFESDRAQDAGWTTDIWKSGSDGRFPVQLTNLHGAAGTPHWSPDGRWIAFDYRPADRSHIYVMDAGGRHLRMLSSAHFEQQVPSWSRDGSALYYTANNTGTWEVWRLDLSTGEERQVTRGGGYIGLESVDGKTLFYSKFDRSGIWAIPLQGGAEEQITAALHHGYWGHFAVVATGIYFLDADAKPAPTIFYFDVHSRRTTPVFQLQGNPLPWTANLAASRDGRRLYFTQSRLTSSIVIVENFQ